MRCYSHRWLSLKSFGLIQSQVYNTYPDKDLPLSLWLLTHPITKYMAMIFIAIRYDCKILIEQKALSFSYMEYNVKATTNKIQHS